MASLIEQDGEMGVRFEFTTTPFLDMMIQSWKQGLSSHEFHHLMTRLDLALHQMIESIKTIPEDNVFAVVAEKMEVEIRKARKRTSHTVQCKSGCGACCHLRVFISKPEAKILADDVNFGRVKIDRDLLDSQVNLDESGLGNQEWFGLPLRQNRCVFLGSDNRCKVYDVRPLNCRKLLVVSDPVNCSNDYATGEPKEVAWLRLPEAEIIASAFMHVYPTEPMPKLLQENLTPCN